MPTVVAPTGMMVAGQAMLTRNSTSRAMVRREPRRTSMKRPSPSRRVGSIQTVSQTTPTSNDRTSRPSRPHSRRRQPPLRPRRDPRKPSGRWSRTAGRVPQCPTICTRSIRRFSPPTTSRGTPTAGLRCPRRSRTVAWQGITAARLRLLKRLDHRTLGIAFRRLGQAQ